MIFMAILISLTIGLSMARIILSKESQSGNNLPDGELYRKEKVKFSINTTIHNVFGE